MDETTAEHDQVLPALCIVSDGSVLDFVEGWHNSTLVGCRQGKADLDWPIGIRDGRRLVTVKKDRAIPVFFCHKDFGEFAIPWEHMTGAMVDWRNRVTRKARNTDGSLDEAIVVEELERLGVDGVNAMFIARVLSDDVRPDTTAAIWERRVMTDVMPKGEGTVGLVVGALVLGLMQGWQLADTILPDFGNSPWFSLALVGILVVGIIMVAWKK